MAELITVDREEFLAKFGKAPFTVHHTLMDHPLLTLDSLGDLADFLPEELVEHNIAEGLDAVLEDGEAELQRVERSPGEVARGIETNRSWMVLKEIERHPDYRDLLNASLDELAGYVEELEGKMVQRKGFIFLSAAGSVTPLHIDNEHSFLLQCRGTKAITIGRYESAEDQNRELERLYRGGNTRYVAQDLDDSQTVDLTPGLGVSVPLSYPHWVQNGDTVSVSLSITFQTPRSLRRAAVYGLNARLRRLHIDPRPPDGDGVRDRLKAATFRAMRAPVRAARALRSGESKPAA